MKRVLHVVSALEVGGAEIMIMDIYRRINHEELQFDFVSHGLKEGEFEEEIRRLGGRVFRINSLGRAGPAAYIKKMVAIMSSGRYDAVHIHTDFQGGVVALAACLAKVKIRICHSHSSSWNRSGRGMQALGLHVLKGMIRLFANQYCACSKEAGHFLFSGNSPSLKILHNTINVKSYQFLNEVDRELERKKYGIQRDEVVIGHVGRFSESKNQSFLLKIIQKLQQNGVKVRAILIGDGPLKKKVEREASKLNVDKYVHFAGIQADIPRWMYLFDVFLFPSLFEGFGITVLEAQCAGTPCVVSNRVPTAIDTGLGLVSFMDLEDPIDKWAETIIATIKLSKPTLPEIHEHFLQNGLNIEDSVWQWEKLYLSAG